MPQNDYQSDRHTDRQNDAGTRGEVWVRARERGLAVPDTYRVTVPYRRGCLTTVSGRFLTAGGGSGGIGLDHDWEDNTFVVEF